MKDTRTEIEDWADRQLARILALERDGLGQQVDWFDRRSLRPIADEVKSSLTPEERAVRDIHRSAAVLGLAWGVSPQFILFALAALAPDEAEWGRLVSGTWDRLPAHQRANLDALATSATVAEVGEEFDRAA